MSPETAAFLAALFRWTLADPNPLDYAETVRGPRDSNVPAFSVVEDRPAASTAPVPSGQAQPGLRVRALMPQQLEAETAGEVRDVVTFPFTSWPLTFAYHNAQLRSRGGRQAVNEGWVVYLAEAQFVATRAGAYTFSLSFRSPAVTSCYSHLVIGGVEVFPDFERSLRRRLPPRIALRVGERRQFSRELRIEGGRFELALVVACHPSGKPSERLTASELANWQATEVTLLVRTPNDVISRFPTSRELVLP